MANGTPHGRMGVVEIFGMAKRGFLMGASDGMDEIDELLEGVGLSMPEWEERLPHECPFCGQSYEYKPQADPDVLAFRCGCGYNGYVMGPYDGRDKRYDFDLGAAVADVQAQIEENRRNDPSWGVPADDDDGDAFDDGMGDWGRR